MTDEIPNKSAEEWIHEAFLYSQDEKFENALECYQNAITVEPKKIIAWYNMALIYNQIGAYRAAIVCIDEVLQLNPNFENAGKLRFEIIEAHPKVLIKKLDSDTQHLIDSLKKQRKGNTANQFRTQLIELRGGFGFVVLGILSIISAITSLIELIFLLGNGLGFSWILLITIIISAISAVVWFMIPQKFDQTADLFVKVINMQLKMMDKESE